MKIEGVRAPFCVIRVTTCQAQPPILVSWQRFRCLAYRQPSKRDNTLSKTNTNRVLNLLYKQDIAIRKGLIF